MSGPRPSPRRTFRGGARAPFPNSGWWSSLHRLCRCKPPARAPCLAWRAERVPTNNSRQRDYMFGSRWQCFINCLIARQPAYLSCPSKCQAHFHFFYWFFPVSGMTQITLEKDFKWIKCQQSEVVSPWISKQNPSIVWFCRSFEILCNNLLADYKDPPCRFGLTEQSWLQYNDRRKQFNVAICVEIPTRIYQGTRGMRLLPVQVNRFNRARKTGSKGKNVGR